ncbi:hypothetical protein FCU94_18540 [Vibrio sp. JPW-9-11-11]|uniref:Lpp/OprI family alanine-zipper lipoprotein n=1 Tax=Vibrio sp. JPW-9-11-11 TaxID=1416532 RepID=UPI001593E10B|nr:Lpp/OprI family alanine-zipper lipoprotein [Vibrio sp. JPW-9-11-11]NVD08850.1 hypothetical protein [Vibrio sp. JPW-9-11-11]
MNKMLIAAATSSVLLLAGCAAGPDQATTAKMDELSNQVSQLSQDVQALQSEVRKSNDSAMAAQEEAARANERIDNIAQSYTK